MDPYFLNDIFENISFKTWKLYIQIQILSKFGQHWFWLVTWYQKCLLPGGTKPLLPESKSTNHQWGFMAVEGNFTGDAQGISMA